MGAFGKVTQRIVQTGPYLLNTLLLSLVIVGVMVIVHNLSFRAPSDGVIWEDSDDGLIAVEVDASIESDLEVGDLLISIDDREILTNNDRQDYLYAFDLDKSRPHLYRVLRGGTELLYWVHIRGLRDGANQVFIAYAISGFAYLVFLFLLTTRTFELQNWRTLAFFCLCVYLAFVFRNTVRFSTLDWLALYLERLGELLLPSAMAGVAVSNGLSESRWRGHVQAIHWAPTALISLVIFVMVLPSELFPSFGLSQDAYEQLFRDLSYIQEKWGGFLVVVSIVLLGVAAKHKQGRRSLALFWAASWLPLALNKLGASYPYDQWLIALLPLLLPIAFLVEWSRSGRLYLGTIAKKVIVYFCVVVTLLTGYAVFIVMFQTLLGAKISSVAHSTILGIGIMFAAVTYGPLNHFVATMLDRMVYGRRYRSIREFTDLSLVRRADTNIDDFLHTIVGRITNTFRVHKVAAYKVGDNAKMFRSIVSADEVLTIVFEDLHAELRRGRLVRGRDIHAFVVGEESRSAFGPNDYICPIRVQDQLTALVTFSLEGNEVQLNPEEEGLLRNVFRQCDVLMENMELYHAVNQKVNSINQLMEYNENIIESSRIGILTTDEMGRALSCNRAVLEIIGQDRDRVMGQTFEALLKDEKVRRRKMRAGFTAEGLYRNARGEVFDLEVQKTPLNTKDNEVYGTLYLIEDVREKKKFNETLMQQEKLASIGMLAAGVAHEINTPLTGITSYAQILNGDPGLNEDQKELTDLILGQGRRAAKIVNELLNFSRKGSGPRGPVDLLYVLNQTIRFLGHQIQKRHVRVTIHELAEPVVTKGYDNQIQQVFVNLIVNAMDAMPEGGDLEVSFRLERTRVMTIFRDTGTGMTEETRQKLFDPFFTTKEVGKGTGLGLAVVYNILQDHHAGVEVESQLGQGTTFTLSWERVVENTATPRREIVL